MIGLSIPADFLPLTSDADRERLWDSHRRNAMRGAAKVRTRRAKEVTRAYFRRLTREGVAINPNGFVPPSIRERAVWSDIRLGRGAWGFSK